MLALKQHLEKVIRGQLQDLKDDAEFGREPQPVHRRARNHISPTQETGRTARCDALLERAGCAVAGLLNTVVPAAVPRLLQRESVTPTGSEVVLLEVNRDGGRKAGAVRTGSPRRCSPRDPPALSYRAAQGLHAPLVVGGTAGKGHGREVAAARPSAWVWFPSSS